MPDEQPLNERRCVPCEGGTPPLGADRIAELLSQVEGWALQQTEEHVSHRRGADAARVVLP